MSTCCLLIYCVVPAVLILAARDAHLRRLWQDRRPLEDQIADIRADAAFMADQLQGLLDRPRSPEPAVDWVPTLLAYFRRLEALAAAPDAAAEEVQRLAEEASTFARQNRLKGSLRVDLSAEKLAVLVRRRDAA